jgi:hypothetical protein
MLTFIHTYIISDNSLLGMLILHLRIQCVVYLDQRTHAMKFSVVIILVYKFKKVKRQFHMYASAPKKNNTL